MARQIHETITCDICKDPITLADRMVEVKLMPESVVGGQDNDDTLPPRFRIDVHERCYERITENAQELKRGRPKGT